MKKIKYITLALGFFALMNSCTGNYLDTPQPTDTLAPDVVYSSYEGAKAHIAGILRRTRGQFTNTENGNLGSMYFARENKGNISINSGSWFGFDYENDNREPNYTRTVFTWRFPYYLINRVNDVIEGVTASSTLTSDQKNELLGQAYTMRAYFYFELSLEFQHTYNFDPNLPAPPIYTSSKVLEGAPMSTMKDLYAFITNDLEKAIQIGSASRPDKSYFNKNVSYAVAARVYQVMGNWGKAKDYATLAYGGNPTAVLSPEFYQSGFDDMNKGNEWLLADPQQADQSNFYYLAPHAFYTRTESAYNNTYINKAFVTLYSATDVRNQFAKTTATDYRMWYTKKFKFSFTGHVPLLRTPEMILIQAEAMFKLGDEPGAHNLLYILQKNRDPQAVKSTTTGNAFYEEILLERQKELYGEMGIEWYDAKRLRRGIKRDSWHRINMANNPLLPDDKRFFLKIPQSELDANPNIPQDINVNR
ncbi:MULTISPECIES: RagB/SusD family nutrient uptake outer membrane protein [Elizabethkingia]|uniref:RagB/SusD family nutrient uptake outer membrane protein n=1 Tax=Elizabethkingia TaxID=308865 RepID=UPI0007398377|nr:MULTISPECIES: RagB/SusD family nutrient uptake outer membrane protein [Elizabethkingia]KUF41641.1 glycan metabolism protein [Elizabethkingia anophelis]MCL1641805.1 RagB/SusD family nutrient uptake outer membrane protein [Elizabethkingia anophelis]MCL1644350.1 RagB/SusD family nutrient uptake outer membrane protein [Elizabethkingia anophelis]MCT3645353.1 RagB/SusD family nutrient uptake outer membrane protein [Elizabethkingia anophelis]MCT3650063.1 RagB/SusD family nutrient uptake outer memb